VITLEHVGKHFGATNVAVRDLSLTIPEGELCVLVGPSGCGKTTTLRMINRLIEPSSGRILIDGTDILQMDPVQLRRGIGYVIQQGGLFPHRRVADNVATVPRLLGWSKERVVARVNELLHLVGLDPDQYGRRFPHELSGGERQRVGVARALGGDPPVLLMDEPFGAVDPVTRQRLQQQLLELQVQLNKTIVLVTHDIEEAAKLGDRIAVLSKGGVLEQYDTPTEVLGSPATEFVGAFVGNERSVRRLAVTCVEVDDLAHPPQVSSEMTMSQARSTWSGSGTGSPWAVVVGEQGRLEGWVDVEANRDGLVREHLVTFGTEITLGCSLREALSAMLQNDLRWIPVVEGGRYLGVLTPNRLHAAMRRTVGGDAGNPVVVANGANARDTAAERR
jgi:osmoprotectant transport system ATP-binding protein